ncbi:ATP synthase F0 subunit B [Streptomyces orinoci]|uniref:ATP synthase F0 subunit B n=1 Tax=Streptomyces orinoci TaxID=67339 RepID=A0ABV3K7Y3_STRON|nr:ATP synthase F0 subunit B [Streptomyces orinoci]
MDVQKKLDEIVTAVAGARSMPMSASCVVNRAELLARLEELRQALPGSLAQAQELIGDREKLVAEAREEAERIIESARAQRGSLISDTEVARRSREEADRILAEARREAEAIRAEADDYVDAQLANFEVVLTKTIGAVGRGREKLLGLAEGGHGEEPDPDLPERSTDPAAQRHNADAYVDAKLAAVSAVLSSTLEAVGRGREKLGGARPIDELAAHLAAQDELQAGSGTGDFLAELAAPQQPQQPEYVPQPQHAPQQPQVPPQQPAYDAYQDYQQPQQPSYDYQPHYAQQTDPYAVPGGYQQPDAYTWPVPNPPGPYPSDGGYGASSPLPQEQVPQQQHSGAALDETSFFDTSMIDLDQLRRYEQGR